MKEPLPGRTGPGSPTPPSSFPDIAPAPALPQDTNPLQGQEGAGASSPRMDNAPLSIPSLISPTDAGDQSAPGVPSAGATPPGGTYTSQGSMGHPNPNASQLVQAIMGSLFSKNSVGGM